VEGRFKLVDIVREVQGIIHVEGATTVKLELKGRIAAIYEGKIRNLARSREHGADRLRMDVALYALWCNEHYVSD
jgi:hypothetical protein